MMNERQLGLHSAFITHHSAFIRALPHGRATAPQNRERKPRGSDPPALAEVGPTQFRHKVFDFAENPVIITFRSPMASRRRRRRENPSRVSPFENPSRQSRAGQGSINPF